jgi:cytochrome P450
MGSWVHPNCDIDNMFCVSLLSSMGIVIVIFTIFCGWYLLPKSLLRKNKAPLPPGTFGLPFIGESFAFIRACKANKVVEEFLNPRIAKYGQTHLLFSPAVSLGAPEGNKFLFSNEYKLVQGSWPLSATTLFGRGSILSKTGKEHNFVPTMHKTTIAHFAQFWEGKDEIMARNPIKHLTFSMATDLFMSIKEGPEFYSLQHHMKAYMAGMRQLPINFPGTVYRKAILGRENMLATLDKVICCRHKDIEEGRISTHPDLLSILISTPDQEGHLATNEEIKDNILSLLWAGHDTTNCTLTVILKYLFLNPHCLHEVIKEQKEIGVAKAGALLNWDDTRKMKYTWQAIQEATRLQPIVQMSFRELLQEFEYEGFTIPKGWRLFWHVGRSHMSPEFFPNPKTFDPSRFGGTGPPPFTYLGFGGGPHSCLGIDFARTEMVVFLHHLVLNYEWSMVDPNEPIAMDPFPTFRKGLHLKIHKKMSSQIS